MTDPIADMLARIRNAFLARHELVEVPHSKLKEALALILKEHGYVADVEVNKSQVPALIRIKLKYVGKVPAITQINRISKPGRRVYSVSKKVPRALGGYGITIVSTNKGVLTDQQARKQNVGGELLCQVW
ncbi:MAG: 30S ribosomal protein S8 [Patescibacteria group bacterium]